MKKVKMCIKKMITWIVKNKEWVFDGIGITIITLLFSMFSLRRESASEIDKKIKEANNIEDNCVVNRGTYPTVIINNYEEQDNNAEEIVMSESKYLEYLQSNVEGDILFYDYNDYDGNGTCEMFALIEDKRPFASLDEKESFYGKIWYIDGNGAVEVESSGIEYWTSPHPFFIGNSTFIAFDQAFAAISKTYIWGVIDGKPYQPNISGKINGIEVNEYGEIEVIHSTYDLEYNKEFDSLVGHSWKKYYFYFDGSTFREYGGINITIDDIMKIPEGEKIVSEAYNHSCDINDIYYRGNNVININISKDKVNYIHYYNVTLRYIDNMWKIVSPDELDNDYGEGYYLRAFIPIVATYPDEYPY